MIKVAVAGAAGRMGRALIEAISAAPEFALAGAIEHTASSYLGKDAGELIGAPNGCIISDDLDATLRDSQILVDFTRPDATLAHLEACVANKVAMVIGTTGFSSEQKQRIAAAAEQIAIEVRGTQVTLASSKAAPISFTADGRTKTENANGRTIRVRATLVRSERVKHAVEDAYAEKYTTPASLKYVKGFRTKRRRDTTFELRP